MSTGRDDDGMQAAVSVVPVADRPSMREEIADSLRAAIVAGQMRPGVIFSVPTLAERFKVSATPVREAMLDLAKEGLVEPVRNKGFRVTELTDKELDDITQLRVLIEVPTVKQLSLTARDEDLEALRPLAQGIVDAAAEGDLIEYLEIDRRFHLRLMALADNPRLVEVVRELRAQTRLYGLEQLVQEGRLTSSAEEHLDLIDSLMSHDPARTEALMRRHIGHVRGIWAAGTRRDTEA